MRRVDYKYICTRNGVQRGELLATRDAPPTISLQTEAEIPSSMQATFLYSADVDFLLDHVHPYMFLDGQWQQMGEYVASSASETYANGTRRIAVELMDQALLVKQSATEGVHFIQKDTRYVDAVRQLLTLSGVVHILSDPCDDVTLTDREDWEEGTSYLTIVNALLREIGFNPLWFDLDGRARLSRYQEASAGNIAHVYKSGEDALILPDCTISEDAYSLYNVFRAVVSNPELEKPLSATAVNDYPRSRTSTVRLGRRIPAPIEKLDNIASQGALDAYVGRKRFESMLSTECVTFTTANLPGHGYLDTVVLQHERLDGIYQEVDWSMTLSHDGKMTHRARRVLYL